MKRQFKHEIRCYKKNGHKLRKVQNNFIQEIQLIQYSNIGYKVLLECDHRHFDIDATSGGENEQGVMLSYHTKPFEEDAKKKEKDEYMIEISLKPFSSEKYDLILDRQKETLELIFVKRSLNQKFIVHKQLRPRKK